MIGYATCTRMLYFMTVLQMDVFRTINTGNYGTELYRPVQPLGARTVTFYSDGNIVVASMSLVVSLAFANIIIYIQKS